MVVLGVWDDVGIEHRIDQWQVVNLTDYNIGFVGCLLGWTFGRLLRLSAHLSATAAAAVNVRVLAQSTYPLLA